MTVGQQTRDTSEITVTESRSEAIPVQRAEKEWLASRLKPALDRPAGFWISATVVAFILAVPAWLFADELRFSSLHVDDFAYISGALDWPTTKANLLRPHNTHIVPLFRLWTAAVVASAGSLEGLPSAFRVASYLGLIATMLLVFLFVARETGRTSLGMAAMAILGVSTVAQPAACWYSAGQALWAGAGIVVTLFMARSWARDGAVWKLLMVAAAALAAAAIWSGGLVAGPAASAYVAAASPNRRRTAIIALSLITILAVAILAGLSRRQITENHQVWEQHRELWPRPVQAVMHSSQAIAENLVFGNLGLDVVTTPSQAIALVAILAGVWLWTHRRFADVTPLEAAGIVMIVASYLLVYFFRGNFPYDSLRSLGWYSAIPQVGVALLAVGWWQALQPRSTTRLTRAEAVAMVGFVGLLCLLQIPRAERRLLQNAPAMTESETRLLPIPELQRLRALYFKEEHLGRQTRALARLTRAKAVAEQLHVGRESLRRIYGHVLVPGIQENQVEYDAFSLLNLPPDDPSRVLDIQRARFVLDDLIRPEPESHPNWEGARDALMRP